MLALMNYQGYSQQKKACVLFSSSAGGTWHAPSTENLSCDVTVPEHVFIIGVPISMKSKHKLLSNFI